MNIKKVNDKPMVLQIAKMLNDEGIASPMRYKYEKGVVKNKRYADSLWNNGTIAAMIVNSVYIGDMEQGTQKEAMYMGIRRHRIKKGDRVYVSGTHEPVVSRALFDRVQKLVKERKQKYLDGKEKHNGIERKENKLNNILFCGDCGGRLKLHSQITPGLCATKNKAGCSRGKAGKPPQRGMGAGGEHPRTYHHLSSVYQGGILFETAESKKMKNIYYCGCCGRALFNDHYGTIFCQQQSFKTDSDCSDIEINKHETDMAVLASVRKETEIFLDRDKLSRQVIKRNSPLSVSDRINSTMMSIEAAQKSWIALYDKYADGKLEREFFLKEKKQYDADMEKLEEELAALRQAQEEEESEQEGSQRKADQAMAFLEEEELTEDMKEKLIEKVIVYQGNRIEIVWKFEGYF